MNIYTRNTVESPSILHEKSSGILPKSRYVSTQRDKAPRPGRRALAHNVGTAEDIGIYGIYPTIYVTPTEIRDI